MLQAAKHKTLQDEDNPKVYGFAGDCRLVIIPYFKIVTPFFRFKSSGYVLGRPSLFQITVLIDC